MNDEHTGDGPESTTSHHPSLPSPSPVTKAQAEFPQNSDNRPQRDQANARELRREFRWFEFASLLVNGVLAVIGVIALTIYGGQLNTMNSQLDVMRATISQNRLALRQGTAQTIVSRKSADAAKGAADTAEKALIIGNRPWVNIRHRIISPLNFDFVGAAGPAAAMTVEDTLENVGQTIALNVLSWEDVIPIDSDYSHRTAIARQHEWCDTNRNSKQTRTVGSILFPHTPAVQNSGMAALMSRVNQALSTSPIKGKVGFVMVGCVVYRSSFEPISHPNHQTRFMYELGIPQGVVWTPYITPTGIALDLRLIETFQTYTAD